MAAPITLPEWAVGRVDIHECQCGAVATVEHVDTVCVDEGNEWYRQDMVPGSLVYHCAAHCPGMRTIYPDGRVEIEYCGAES